MQALNRIVVQLIDRHHHKELPITLLAACPNSAAVLEAAVLAAQREHMPMLFAATLNQVDRDGGYTGWTPGEFVSEMNALAIKHGWDGPLYPCLDHGGPWLKDRHSLDHLSLTETMAEVKRSLTACIEAGYQLLHIDPTVDRTLPPGQPPAVEVVVERTLELMAHSESERQRLGLPAVSYEVGTEEVHGGLVAFEQFERFLVLLQAGLADLNLDSAWPCFVVAQVGTDLHTTHFDTQAAWRIFEQIAPLGSLAKGHYTDWVENPEAYPLSGMGGANVGPEFTAEEYQALKELVWREVLLAHHQPRMETSGFMEALQGAVIDSGRWKKWLQPDEQEAKFFRLPVERQEWLTQTGARYVWTDPNVVARRSRLYENLSRVVPDPHGYVVERIARCIQKYALAFNLFDSLRTFDSSL